MKLVSGEMMEMDDEPPSPTTRQPETFSFSDDKLSDSVLTSMDTLRQAGHLCDCVLRVQDKSAEFAAHQAVLASVSPYFMSLFEQDPRTEVRKWYTVKSVTTEAMQILLDYCYTGSINMRIEHLKDVYQAAQKLKFNKVRNACSDYILQSLDINNCIEWRTFTADNSYLAAKIDNFIQSKMDAIMNTKALMNLPQISFKLLGYDRGISAGPISATVAKLIGDWLLSTSARIQDGDSSVLEVEAESRSKSRNNGSRTDVAVLTEHENVLWLDDDNHIQDATLAEEIISKADVVQDYVKACRKFNKKGPTTHISLPELHSGDNGKSLEIIAHSKLDDGSYSVLVSIRCCVYHMTIRMQTISDPYQNGRRPSGSSQSASAASSAEEDEEAAELMPWMNGSVSSYIPLANMNSPRNGVGLAALNGTLIALGGNDRGECLSSVEAYDTQTNKWSNLPPMRCARGRFECAVLGGQLYACGGSDGRRELNSVEYFDGENWQTTSKMTSSKSSAGVGVLNNKLYVVGGYNGQTAEKTCEVYDPQAKRWSFIAPLNNGRSQAAVCSFKGLLYAFGGTDSWNCFMTAEVYDPAVGVWKNVTPLTQARRGAAATVFKGKIYVVGGSDGQRSLDAVDIYDPDTSMWTSGPALLTPRSNAGLAVLDGCLYVVGGYGKNEFLSSLEVLEGDADSQWCSYVRKRRLSAADFSHSSDSDPGYDCSHS